MKVGGTARHSPEVQLVIEDRLRAEAALPLSEQTRDLGLIYREHADFVWRTLQHLGVQSADLEDLLQEVFITVHRRLSTFRGESRLSTWLFGISLRLVQRHRRRAYFRWELPTAEPPEQIELRTPEDRYNQHQADVQLRALLWRLSPERRATFVLFEIEGTSCAEIADLTGVPVGTVYSRLHAARKHVSKRLSKRRETER